jgi:nitronate monooxygenase
VGEVAAGVNALIARESSLEVPIVGAPMAGGPSTPALAAAVSDAGGLGFLAAGYRTAEAVQAEIAAVRSTTVRPFGVNLFCPTRDEVDEAAIAAYADSLRGEEERYGARVGDPTWSDDEWDAKLNVVAGERPDVVSFTFGFPDRETVEWLRGLDIAVWATVTSPAEAGVALASGADALVLQGAEAGGHQGSFRRHDDEPLPIQALLQLVAPMTDRPLVAAGGIATAAGIAAVRRAGASAAQVGSALMLAEEAGTSEPHRRALRGDAPTRLTRAFTGRRARGIVNRFMVEHDEDAPVAYPEIHYLTAPLRAKARALGDADGINLWAGQAYQLAAEATAGEIVERWGAELAHLER